MPVHLYRQVISRFDRMERYDHFTESPHTWTAPPGYEGMMTLQDVRRKAQVGDKLVSFGFLSMRYCVTGRLPSPPSGARLRLLGPVLVDRGQPGEAQAGRGRGGGGAGHADTHRHRLGRRGP
jgi:hypothetical protein